MSDNRTRLKVIHRALKRLCPFTPNGHIARRQFTLAMLISGIVGSKQVQLPAIASKVPWENQAESRIKRFKRWITHEQVDYQTYYLPYVEQLLANLCNEDSPIVLVMDGSEVGRKCRALTLNVVYQNRALPLAWHVARGSRGHFLQTDHIALIRQIAPLIPKTTEVVFLGDGEFDGTDLLTEIDNEGWSYVCRTALDTLITQKGNTFAFEQLSLCPGMRQTLLSVTITTRQYGPLQAIAAWDEDFDAPIYLVSNLDIYSDPLEWYRLRFCIETFFSDQKSRGFHLHKSHISDPGRIALLMIAACLAYIWIIYLGRRAQTHGYTSIIHRRDRCDLSLFQLGLRLLDYLIDQQMTIPVAFDRVE